MNCEICEIRFDYGEHKPLCIIPCTHTYCLTCVSRLRRKKCPKCDTLIQKTNPNWSLINLIPDFFYTRSTNESLSSFFANNSNKKSPRNSTTSTNNSGSPHLEEAAALFSQGLEKYYQKEYKESVELYDQAIKLNPTNVINFSLIIDL